MTSVICEVLQAKLRELAWIDEGGKIAGLVQYAQRPTLKYVEGSPYPVIVGYQTAPVACGVNLADCWENQIYKGLEPDSSKSVVAYFVDTDGTRFVSYDGAKRSFLKFRFGVKLVVWMNTQKLGTDVTAGVCQPSGRVSPYLMQKLFGRHSPVGLFGGGIEESVFQGIEVTGVSELPKTTAVFAPFSFAQDNEKRGLFLYPYDYLALQIQGEYLVNKNCLPELVDDWSPGETCFAVPPVDDGFCRRMLRCLGNIGGSEEEGTLIDGCTFYWTPDNDVQVPGNVLRCVGDIPTANSDEEGLLIGKEVDGFVYYWTGDNHSQSPNGLLKRLAV